MAGARRGRRAGILVVAALAQCAAIAVPAAARAMDPSDAQVLPGRTVAAAVVDLDGDGTREVVRLVGRSGPGLDIDAWEFAGEWRRIGSAELVTPEAPGTAPTIPESGTAALLPWSVEGTDRLLALTGSWELDAEFSRPCCLTIREVAATAAGIELVELAGSSSADMVLAADLDGDGSDELVTSMQSYEDEGDDGTFELSVLRWNGTGFEVAFDWERDGQGYGIVAGDADGRPGEEVYVNPIWRGTLQRIVSIADGIAVESGHVNLGERIEGWASGVTNGSVLVSVPDGFHLFDWPADAQLRPISRVASSIYPTVGVLGEGGDALYVTHDGLAFGSDTAPVATIYDADLDEIGSVGATPDSAALWELIRDSNSGATTISTPLWPALGPFPGTVDGRPAYLVGDVLLQPDGKGGYTERPIAPIMSLSLIGRAGPDDEWAALGDVWFGPPAAGAYLTSYDGFFPGGQGTLTLVPVSELLAPRGELELVDVRVDGVVEAGGDDGVPSLVAGPEGFVVTVHAPDRTRVISGGRRPVAEELISNGEASVEFRPRSSRNERDEEFSEWLLVITPSGRATMKTWDGTYLREPPELTTSVRTELLSGTARVMGRGSDLATILVDGAPVERNRFGAFHVEVDAPIWPRTVTVTARDPFGREVSERIEVVGFVDYRGLPWVPIVAIATVAAGALLFVRTPGLPRRSEPREGWGDVQLEEIDAD